MTNSPEKNVFINSSSPELAKPIPANEALKREDLFEIPQELCLAAGFLGEMRIRLCKDIFLRLTKTETNVSTTQLNERSLTELSKFLQKLNLTIKDNKDFSPITFDYLFDSQKCTCTAFVDSSHGRAIHVESKEEQDE